MINPILEILIALLAAAGLIMTGWLLFGRMLTPVGKNGMPVYAVIPARGGGEGLEHTVNGLKWLLGGKLASFTIVVADGGLDREGLTAAEALSLEQNLVFCPADSLGSCIMRMEQSRRA